MILPVPRRQYWNPLKPPAWHRQKQKTITFRKEKQRSGSNHVPRIRACAAKHIYAAKLREAVSLGEYFATFRKHYDLSKRRELLTQRQSITFHTTSIFSAPL